MNESSSAGSPVEPPLAGKVAVVTGGASGIGRATAIALAGRGADVAILDVAEAAADAVAGRVADQGRRALAIAIDLDRTAQIAGAVERVLAELGRIDILVNAAGIARGGGTILELDDAGWDRVRRIDFTAPLVLMHHVARHMVARGGGGKIVNVSSSSAFRAVMASPAYACAKAALVTLTRVAAAELGPHDINVNAVAPGLTRTPIVGTQDEDALTRMVSEGPLANLFHRLSEPEDVAEAIVFLCLPASRQITAQVIHTSAGAVI